MNRLTVFRFRAALLSLLFLFALTPAGFSGRAVVASDPVLFAVIGDGGTGERPQYEVAEQMKAQRDKQKFDFVLMVGDNIYPDGHQSGFKAKFEEPYKDLLKDGVKFYAVLGNHDNRSGTEAQIHYDKFHMDGNRYYNFDKGKNLIEFFALDSNDMDPKQIGWFEEKLKASKATWKIAYFHHPIYSSGKFHGSDKTLRAKLEPLFVRYAVDVVFAGHDHVYERVKPQLGVQYFTEGASGQLRRGNLNRKTPFFEAGNDQINSFLVVRADEAQLTVQAIGSNGVLLDSHTMEKKKAAATTGV